MPGEHQSDRTAGFHRGQCGKRGNQAILGPKAPANLCGIDRNLLRRKVENLGQVVALGELTLGGHPDGEVAGDRVPGGRGRLGLDVALMHHGDAVGVLHDDVSFGKALGHVTLPEDDAVGDVAGLLGLLPLNRFTGMEVHRLPVGLTFVADNGRGGLHGLQRIEHVGKRSVGHLNEVQCPFGRAQILGNYYRHRLSDEESPTTSQKVVASRGRVVLGDVGQIGRGDDGHHTGEGLGAAGVNVEDISVGVGATQHLCMKQTRETDIGTEDGPARYLIPSVYARQWFADSDVLAHEIVLLTPRQRSGWHARSCRNRCSGIDCRR